MLLVQIERIGGILFLCAGVICVLYFFFGPNGVPNYNTLKAFHGTFQQVSVIEEPAVKITLNSIDTNDRFVFISNNNDAFKIYTVLKTLKKGSPVTILHEKDDNKNYKTSFQVKINDIPIDSYAHFEERMNERHKRFLYLALSCIAAGLYALWGVRGK